MGQKTKQIALNYLEAGLSVIPTSKDKVPICEWGAFQKQLPSTQQVGEWSKQTSYIGIVAGKISGNLEMIDFDDQGAFVEWRNRVSDEAPGLFDKIIIESTQNDNFHVIYRCPEVQIPGNLKLAQRMNETKLKTLIETRGEGGYFVCAPSPGYRLKQGSFESVPEITRQERDVLIRVARSLNEHIEPNKVINGSKPAPRSNSNGLSPGDDFNERGDVRAVLAKHGWHFDKSKGTYEYWRRPGKDRGHSASLMDGKNLYVFTSNANPFEAGESYSKFAVYTLLEHGGDYSAAAKALAQQGYGEQKQSSRQQKRKAKLQTRAGLKGRFCEVVEYQWRNHFPKRNPIIVNGREGEGKTTICLGAAGEMLEQYPEGYIIWIASEGFVQDTYNKMETLGIDENRFFLLEHSNGTYQFNFATRQDLKELDEALADCKDSSMEVLAVFVDSIRGIAPFDDNDSKIKNVLMAVNSIVCDKYGASLIYIDHHKKGQSQSLLDRSVGTTAKTAAVRRVFSVLPVSTYVRKICLAKSNILGDSPPELMAALHDDRLVIYEAAETADTTLIGQAEHWLMEMFSKRESYKATDIYSEGEKLGYSTDVLKKAKKNLGIDSWKDKGMGSSWYWSCTTFLEKRLRHSSENKLFGD